MPSSRGNPGQLDAAGVGTLAQQLQLITPEQFREAWDDAEDRSAEALVRVLERKGFITPFQGAKLLKGEIDGYTLGGYRLLYRIASGSFGRVFRGDDPRTGLVVAIKVLRRRWMEDPQKVVLFEREGKVGLSLQHPNIVRILAVSRDPSTGQYYMVMEFVEGGTLRDFLRIRKVVDWPETLKITEEMTAGLAYAFSRGLLHRDLKPTNVLISAQGVTKLVDFGLAEITGGEAEDDDTEVARTVDYAGLERTTGVKSGDERSDIFFLGCIVYEMLTGRPYLPPVKDRQARMAKSRFTSLAPVRHEDIPNAPAQFVPLLNRMLAVDPTQRFQTPGQLFQAIRTLQAELNGTPAKVLDPDGPATLYLIEPHPKLQEPLREKFREEGYRVLLASDPIRALQRYEQQPYHVLIVDVGAAGAEGLQVLEQVQQKAESLGLRCLSIALLNDDQASLVTSVRQRPTVALMVRPVSLRQLLSKLNELRGG
jgi:serine/threonine protein kinase